MGSWQIVPLEDGHLRDAADLVARRYRALRREAPDLPPGWQEGSAVLPLVRDMAGNGPGVAALDGGRLVGFLLGMPLPHFRGGRGVYSPEWANGVVAASPGDARQIYREMYARLSARWLANGCFVQAISLLAGDPAAIDAWYWLGFGLSTVDGIRDLAAVDGAGAPVEIRRAGPEDAGTVARLEDALKRHMAAAPIFVALMSPSRRAESEKWLSDPAHVLWLAYEDGQAVAYMRQGPANPMACTIVGDEETASISGAYTLPELRGQGIAAALLDRVLAEARERGYARCAVDFESANLPASRFWMHHFQPVCFSLVRHVDERLAWANERRQSGDMW